MGRIKKYAVRFCVMIMFTGIMGYLPGNIDRIEAASKIKVKESYKRHWERL